MTSRPTHGTVPVGWTHRKGRRAWLRLIDRDFRRHGLVLGRTGAGKTMAMLGMMLWCLIHRPTWRWVLVDPKGELASLVEELLGALTTGRASLTPRDITIVSPWSGRLVPLNLLRLMGLPPDIHAGLVVTLLESYLGEQFGGRSRPMLHAVVAAALELRGSLSTCLAILEDPLVAEAVAARIQDPSLRRFLLHVLPKEPEASRSSLRSRLRTLLQVRSIKAMLEADDCLADERLIGSSVTLFNFGGAPAGCHSLSLALSSWLLDLTLQACFNRKEGSPPLFLVVDEAQAVIRQSGSGLEKAMQELRWKNTSLISMTQSVEQLRNPAFKTALMTNVSNLFILDGSPADMKLIEPALPRATGAMVAPSGDHVLTKTEETSMRREYLTSGHGPRQGVYADLSNRICVPFRSASVPLDKLRARAAKLSKAEREAWSRGRWSMTQEELEKRAVRPESELTISVSSSSSVQSRRRPKLKLPQ